MLVTKMENRWIGTGLREFEFFFGHLGISCGHVSCAVGHGSRGLGKVRAADTSVRVVRTEMVFKDIRMDEIIKGKKKRPRT